MVYFVYILRSLKDGSLYIGYTKDLERRLEEHNNGRSRFTRKKIPWEIFYYELYQLKGEAIKRERFLKGQRNTSFYMELRKRNSMVR